MGERVQSSVGRCQTSLLNERQSTVNARSENVLLKVTLGSCMIEDEWHVLHTEQIAFSIIEQEFLTQDVGKAAFGDLDLHGTHIVHEVKAELFISGIQNSHDP